MEPPISPMMTIPITHASKMVCSQTIQRQTFSIGIFEEDLDDVNMLGAREWVAPDSDAQRLTKPDTSCLGNSFVR